MRVLSNFQAQKHPKTQISQVFPNNIIPHLVKSHRVGVGLNAYPYLAVFHKIPFFAFSVFWVVSERKEDEAVLFRFYAFARQHTSPKSEEPKNLRYCYFGWVRQQYRKEVARHKKA